LLIGALAMEFFSFEKAESILAAHIDTVKNLLHAKNCGNHNSCGFLTIKTSPKKFAKQKKAKL
jgi:hypothetical protein